MHWSWPLWGWGLLIGVVGALGSYAVARLADLAANSWAAYRGLAVTTVLLATAAATFRIGWLDVAFALYVATANFAVPMVMLPRLRRRPAHRCSASATCSATACATCPISAQAREA